ncbi:MAG: beta-N-acetylhexosaminidase [Xanthomonadales bacterium]|nr:beta-N-acetylhexosaminidase [Xanthomonadales bacterium]
MRSHEASKALPLGPLLIGLSGLELRNEAIDWLRHPAVGGVVLFTRNYQNIEQLTKLTNEIISSSGRDLLICVDHEGGRVQRFKEGFTRLPPLAVLGKMYIESPANAKDFAYRHGRVMATELRLCGVDLSFAPVLDVGDRSIVIGDRAFAADSDVIIDLSTAYIAGMHDAGMSSTGKHFPGHGSVEADSHTADVCDPRALEEIEQLDLKPFAALSDKLDAMMMAHVLYPAVDDLPAGYSSFWINTVLRQKLNYRGTIFSDDLGMFAARTAGNLVDRVRDSLAAGCDSALICDPDDARGLLAEHDEAFADADAAIRRLKGRFTASRDEIEQVSEWQQWKHSIKQLELEQSKWA